MSSRLHRIHNWPELARQSNGSVVALAKQCNVSVRTLERYFIENMGKAPKLWLAEQRQHRADGHLKDGNSIKETAAILGYKHATHFSRDFKRQSGHSPSTEV